MCRQAGDSHFLTTWIRKHGLATFVHERLECSLVDQSPEQSETEWMCIDVAGCKIINVYKPPRSRLAPIRPSRHFHIHTPVCNWWFQLPTWQLGYSKTSPNGESLNLRETANTLGLLYDAKEGISFSSHRWNVHTNRDLAFVGDNQDNRMLDRRVLEKFKREQHGPSLPLKIPAFSDPVKRGSFERLIGSTFAFLQPNTLRDFHLLHNKHREDI